MIWSPLASGFLSGKYTRENLKDQENRLSGFDFLPFDKEQGFRLIEEMRPIALGHDASVAQIGLAWLLEKPGVDTILLGASKPTQLDDNLRAMRVKLTDDEIRLLDQLSPHASYYPTWFTDTLRDAPVDHALASGGLTESARSEGAVRP
jgi:aryl-alcohol dehydrogenase-like predicted oxidoreductase